MTDPSRKRETRTRREPPPFRTLTVGRVSRLSPFMVRITTTGSELEGFELVEPAASIRLLLPSDDTGDLVIPEWNGNEFLLPGGQRPVIRTFTPRRFHPDAHELDIDIVLHEGGAASAWAEQARPGDPVAVSGPGRGYRLDRAAGSYLLAGDETAIPAIGQLLEEIPAAVEVRVVIEIAHPQARIDLPDHPAAHIVWVERDSGTSPGAALIEALRDTPIARGTRIWVAGEAGSLVQVRRLLFEERALPRSDATVRGYWKHGR